MSRLWVKLMGIWTRYAVLNIWSKNGGSHPRIVSVPPRFGDCARDAPGCRALLARATLPIPRRRRRVRVNACSRLNVAPQIPESLAFLAGPGGHLRRVDRDRRASRALRFVVRR